jgi:putative ATP-dependent endonuclease of OLD family
LHIKLNPGLNLLVGENDSGKTAIVDAIKYVLLTQSYEYYRLEDEDFYISDTVGEDERTTELKIECIFRGFTTTEAANFLEWLSFEKDEDGSSIYYLRVVLKARRENGRIYRDIRAGHEDQGSLLDEKARDLLRVVYLKPLRDAELELSPRRNSRLSQVLHSHRDFADKDNHPLKEAINEANCLIEDFFKCESIVPSIEEVEEEVTTGDDQSQPITASSPNEVAEEETIMDDTQQEPAEAPKTQVLSQINNLLDQFSSKNRTLKSNISISDMSLKAILEKLSLAVDSNKVGLGSNNLLFIATELLLLQKENYNGLKLSLIEEVEAHLHPQAQLRLIDFLQAEIEQNDENIQLLLTTHSPNLASKIKLENLIVCKNGKVFNMGPDHTKLEKGDYLFLERFLDVTKANLFFAEGVILVEGDAENILIPTIAEVIDLPLSRYGVSVVNVGSTAFLRYSRVFQRKNPDNIMDTPVAIITDCDVKPDDYYVALGKDLPEKEYLERNKSGIEDKEGYYREIPVEPFVSPFWTLEYVIALSELKEYFYRAVLYAHKIENSNSIGLTSEKEKAVNSEVESNLKKWAAENWTDEQIAFEIYNNTMLKKSISKAIVSQCFAKILNELPKDDTKKLLLKDTSNLKYIVDAIIYATSGTVSLGEE